MSTAEYTLLLVESPTIASIIDRLSIPYLETIATHGYCWYPHWDTHNHKLTARANPDHVELRKKIKKQAQWATRVIIATDQDPSGVFIAHALYRHLRSQRDDILQTRLHALSANAIKTSLEQASPYTERSFYRLVNRSLIQRKLKACLNESIPGLSSPLYWLALVLSSSIQQNNSLYKPNEHTPWSTLDLLIQSAQRQFGDQQEELNRLFTKVLPDENPDLQGGIISYPRSGERGYYPTTWQEIEREWLTEQDLEMLKPHFLRSTIDTSRPHEAIHPLHLSQTPQKIRPSVNRTQYQMYQTLYDHHTEVIQMPSMDYKPNPNPNNDGFHLAMHLHAIRPSNLGKALDELINKQWIAIDSRDDKMTIVKADNEAKEFVSRIATPLSPIVETLSECVETEALTPEYVDTVLEPLMESM